MRPELVTAALHAGGTTTGGQGEACAPAANQWPAARSLRLPTREDFARSREKLARLPPINCPPPREACAPACLPLGRGKGDGAPVLWAGGEPLRASRERRTREESGGEWGAGRVRAGPPAGHPRRFAGSTQPSSVVKLDLSFPIRPG
jgi:hypothetical protein